MARISKVPVKWTVGTLRPSYFIQVNVASFRFGFRSKEHLIETLRYFEQKIHPSSRVPAAKLEADLGPDWRSLRGWEVERWFERLPMYLFEEPKRQKVVKALRKALQKVEAGKL